MSQKVIFTIGIQGSGKSTWAEQYIKKHQDFKRINRDTFRHMLSNYTFNDTNEQLVQKVWEETVRQTLQSGFNLIIDEMNLNKESVKKSLDFITSIVPDIEVSSETFKVTLDKAIERDLRRPFSVGEKVIRRTWNKYMVGKPEKDCYNFVSDDRPSAVIFDMDKTLSRQWEGRNIYDGSLAHKDYPIKQTLVILESLFDNFDILIVSGRGEHDRKVTEDWLKNLDLDYMFTLFMRQDGDKRQDAIIKKEIYKQQIEPEYNVLAWFDDRKQVLRMIQNELGIFTFDVSQDCDTLEEY